MSKVHDIVAARQRIAELERRLSAKTTQLILALDQIQQLKEALAEQGLEIVYGNRETDGRTGQGL